MRFPTPILTVLAGLACVTPAAHAAERLYWVNTAANVISYANLDGPGSGDLQISGVPVDQPLGLAIDSATGRIYWANDGATDASISYADLDGSQGGTLSTSGAAQGGAYGLAIDPANRRIYWADPLGSISFADLDGSGGGNVDTHGATVDAPTGVAVDPTAQRIYWTNFVGDSISYASLDGSGNGNISTTFATVHNPFGLAIDHSAERLYWVNDYSLQAISFANLASFGGGDLPIGAADGEAPEGVAIDDTSKRIYWANALDNRLSYASTDGRGGANLNTGRATVSTPDFPILLEQPRGAGAPVVSGSTPGSALSCSTGTWEADQVEAFLYRAPHTYAYQWSVDGTDIPGATAARYEPAVGGAYRCRVTATNAAGSAPQTSDPVAVAVAVASPPGTGAGQPAGGSGSPTPTPGGPLSTTPTISGLRETHARFLGVMPASTPTIGYTATSRRARGTVFGFRLDRPATVEIAIRPTVRARGVAVSRLTRRAHTGLNRVAFSGRIRGRALRPGRYSATFTATNAVGPSTTWVLRFTIVR